MNYLKATICLFALGCMVNMAVATIAISISQDTTPGMADHLVISYSSSANYLTFPQNLWNNHVFTVRWPDSLGANVLCGLTDIHGFQFAADPGVQGSPYQCGDYYYQKIVTLAIAKQFNLNVGQTVEMLKIRICLPDTIACGFFELADCPDTCVVNNFGCAAINNAVSGDQFCSIGVGAAACQPLQSIEPAVYATPIDEGYIRVALTQLRDTDWKSCQLMRSNDGHRFDLVKMWIQGQSEDDNSLLFDDQGIQPGVRYFYRAHVRQLSDAVITTPTVNAQLEPLKSQFRVYPVPTNGDLFLEGYLWKQGRLWVSLTDVVGRKMFDWSAQSQAGFRREHFSISHLPKGKYFLLVQGEEGNLLNRVIFLE